MGAQLKSGQNPLWTDSIKVDSTSEVLNMKKSYKKATSSKS